MEFNLMLHALSHRKIRLDKFRPASEAERLEDLIVSSVFGPWGLLSPQSQIAMLGSLLERAQLGVDVAPELGQVRRLQTDFWPRLDAGHLGRSHVEPDVLWQIEPDTGAPLLVVLEAKWNSPLSDQQLEQQRAALVRSQPHARIVQLLLTRRYDALSSSAVSAAGGAGPTGWLRWDDVLATIRTHSSALHRQLQPLMRLLAEWEFHGVDAGFLATVDLSDARGWQVQAMGDARWPAPAALPRLPWTFHATLR